MSSSEDRARRALEALKRASFEAPSKERVARLRTEILVRAEAEQERMRAPRPRRVSLAIACFAAAASIVVALSMVLDSHRVGSAEVAPVAEQTSPPASEVHRGVVRAEAGARYRLVSPAPDEKVELYDGTLAIEVSPLLPGERFRVMLSDGEVEVRGTSFHISALAGKLVGVRVDHGRVEVHTPKKVELVNTAEVWSPPKAGAAIDRPRGAKIPANMPAKTSAKTPAKTGEATPGEESLPAKAEDRTKEVAATPAPKTTTVSAVNVAEEEFARGMSALRSANFSIAADAFERAIAADSRGAINEDARYWRAVALARAGDSERAILSLQSLLRHHPRSVRVGEANAMLGWMLFARGDVALAAPCFQIAESDSQPAVRASARAGLESVKNARRR